MQNCCGQCRKPFSLACEKSFRCQLHSSDCFSCKPCKQTAPLQSTKVVKCSLCPRAYPEEDLYYQYRCKSYICCHHFLKQEFHTSQFKLACGHMEDADQIICYMSNFCIYCGRKMHFNNSWCIGICLPCQKNASMQESLPPLEEKAPSKQPAEEQNPPEYKKFQLSSLSEDESQMQIVRILQRELEDTHRRLEVADHSRKQMRKILLNGDRDCPICLQSYDMQARKPFMICLMQHLVCQHCYNSQVGLTKCPLCHQPIVREHVMVSRQKRITLQLQCFLTQKYDYHLDQLLQHKNEIEQKKKAEVPEQNECLKQQQIQAKQRKIMVSQQTQTNQSKKILDWCSIVPIETKEGLRPPKATKSRSAAALKPGKK